MSTRRTLRGAALAAVEASAVTADSSFSLRVWLTSVSSPWLDDITEGGPSGGGTSLGASTSTDDFRSRLCPFPFGTKMTSTLLSCEPCDAVLFFFASVTDLVAGFLLRTILFFLVLPILLFFFWIKRFLEGLVTSRVEEASSPIKFLTSEE